MHLLRNHLDHILIWVLHRHIANALVKTNIWRISVVFPTFYLFIYFHRLAFTNSSSGVGRFLLYFSSYLGPTFVFARIIVKRYLFFWALTVSAYCLLWCELHVVSSLVSIKRRCLTHFGSRKLHVFFLFNFKIFAGNIGNDHLFSHFFARSTVFKQWWPSHICFRERELFFAELAETSLEPKVYSRD